MTAMAKNKNKKTPEQQKKEALLALVLFVAATAFFIFSIINFVIKEG